MKPVGKPDAGNLHVRFDERGWERGGAPASVLAPILDSTRQVLILHQEFLVDQSGHVEPKAARMWLCSSSTSIIEYRDFSAHLNILTIRGELAATDGAVLMRSPAVQVEEKLVDLGIAAIRLEERSDGDADRPRNREFRYGLRARPAYRREVTLTYVDGQ